jgi:hypothetical protein
MNEKLSSSTPTPRTKRPSFFANFLMMVIVLAINQWLHPKPHPINLDALKIHDPMGLQIPLGQGRSLLIPPYHDPRLEASPQ